MFPSETGGLILFERFSKTQKLSDSIAKQRFDIAVKFFDDENILITNKRLRQTGLGSKLVNQLYKDYLHEKVIRQVEAD